MNFYTSSTDGNIPKPFIMQDERDVFVRYKSYTNMPHLLKEYYQFLLPDSVVKKLYIM